jgi:DNA primase
MDSQIEEIKAKLNIVEVVGSYVKLTKTGVNHRGVCPFHSEKGPSFFVSPARQMWHCFGCGVGGDIFEFIKKIEGIEFGDALRILANKAGVELKRENPQLSSDRKRLYEICELACSFFEKQLEGSGWGKNAKEYLLKRGIKEETLKKWRLGYSPDTWQGLSDFLVGRGYTRQEIVKAGLAVQSEKGNNPYDRFRGRIIFPIFDINSQPIGFGARIFKEADKKETAKYINTPQTSLYDKSNVLYGINFAKLPVRKQNYCVLTEGYTDAIMCHQAGFENTVAVSGTALTPRHLNILKRYSDNLLLSFDMDSAGDNATKRGINLAEAQGFNIKIIDTYSGAKDPAEIILENPENWEESIKKARSIMEYYFDSAFSKFDKKTPEGKKEIGKIILPAIKRIQNKIEQSHWIQKLAQGLGIREEGILEELKTIKTEVLPEQDIKKVEQKGFTENSRKKLLEDRIISLILKNPYNFNLFEVADYAMFSDQNKEFLENLNKVSSPVFASLEEPGSEEKLTAIFADILQKDEYKNFAVLSLLAEEESEGDGSNEVELCIKQLKVIKRREELNNISSLLTIKMDEEKEEELKKEFNIKAKELHFKI